VLNEGDEIVLADALEHEKRCGNVSAIDYEVRAARRNRIGIPGPKPHLLLGVAQKNSDAPLENVERILDVAVVVPGYLLRRRNLEFVDAKAGPLGVMNSALDFIEAACVRNRLHLFLLLGGWK
jgi:hypothetical protein